MMMLSNSKRLLVGTLIGSVMVLGQVTALDRAIAQPPLVPLPPVYKEITLPVPVTQAVKQDVSQNFGVPVSQLKVTGSTQQMWPDGCLGLVPKGVFCIQKIVPGWRVTVTDGIQTWNYRTDATGAVVKLEAADQARLPVAVAQKLVQRVAKENRVSVASLKVTEVRERIFDGCLGIYRPNQLCTKIGIKGWQAIVRSPQRTWVYHLNSDASRIERNFTASGAKGNVRTAFDNMLNGEQPALDATIVFQRTVSGGLAGMMNKVVLTEDGKVTSYSSSPLTRQAPVLIKTLTPAEIKAFKQQLETQRYPNLNGLTYLTDAVLADYPGSMFEAPSGMVQYVDIEPGNLPRSLQNVIRAWDVLTQVNKPA
jgi:hypothetical protein